MLTIRDTRVFSGPSLWAPVPAIVLEVDSGELEGLLSTQTPVFFEPLVALVPSLSDYSTLVSQPEGGLKRLLLDRLALALQQIVGATVTYAQTLPTAERGVYAVVYEYQQEEVGRASGLLAIRLLNHLLSLGEPDFDFAHQLEVTIVNTAKRFAYDIDTATVVTAAQRRQIPVLRLKSDRTIVQFGNGVYQRRLSQRDTSDTAFIAISIAKDKSLTNRLLAESGIPVPRSTAAKTADKAVTAARRTGYPVVLKPLDGSRGRGVCIDLGTDAAVREFFPIAAQESRSGTVVVESYISGKDYRILVVNNQVVAVVERVPAHVIGDGTHSIRQLIERTNEDPLRSAYPILAKISTNKQTLETLAKQDLTLDDIPREGQFVQLKLTANVSTGGTKIDRTDEIHPDNVAIARQAAAIIGLDIAGVDLISPDISRSVLETGGGIVEVNSRPGLTIHTHPTIGMPRDVGAAIVNALFPLGQPFRVPVMAVTGSNGATTSRMIAHIMKTAGKKVGLTTSGGMYVDEMQIAGGDCSDPASARMVLRNPGVDFAVFETALQGILRWGLGFDRCDVAVVTNIFDDRLNSDGIPAVEEPAGVTAVVLQAVCPGGTSVLNADDEWTVKLAETAHGAVIFFSLDEKNPVVGDHLLKGGKAVVLRQTPAGEMLTLRVSGEETSLLLVRKIPGAMDERIGRASQNAMAAIAAAIAQNVPVEVIRTALCSFSTA